MFSLSSLLLSDILPPFALSPRHFSNIAYTRMPPSPRVSHVSSSSSSQCSSRWSNNMHAYMLFLRGEEEKIEMDGRRPSSSSARLERKGTLLSFLPSTFPFPSCLPFILSLFQPGEPCSAALSHIPQENRGEAK